MQEAAPLTGFAYTTAIQFDKAPTALGHRVMSFDPTGLNADDVALVGNSVVELGVAVGAIDLDHVKSVPNGKPVLINEHAKDWCASVSCMHAYACGKFCCIAQPDTFCHVLAVCDQPSLGGAASQGAEVYAREGTTRRA